MKTSVAASSRLVAATFMRTRFRRRRASSAASAGSAGLTVVMMACRIRTRSGQTSSTTSAWSAWFSGCGPSSVATTMSSRRIPQRPGR